MHKFKIFTSYDDIMFLMDRFDVNKDGKISRSEVKLKVFTYFYSLSMNSFYKYYFLF